MMASANTHALVHVALDRNLASFPRWKSETARAGGSLRDDPHAITMKSLYFCKPTVYQCW